MTTQANHLPVLAVCGFGRCGSSLLMQMLSAGGIETTGPYPSFEDYRSNFVSFDLPWFAEQRGRAVKILDPHKAPSIDGVSHVAIWIDRDPGEQAKSFSKFLRATMAIDMTRVTRRRFEKSFRRERQDAMRKASTDPARLFRLTFEQLVEQPQFVLSVLAPWLEGFGFRIAQDAALTAVVPRGRKCLPYFLEASLIAGRTA